MTIAPENAAAPSRRGRLTAAWRSGPLALPGFRWLTFGQLTSTVGDYCYAVALPWLVLSGHGSAASLGIVLACYGIPRAVLTVPAGSLADRLGPRPVMLLADVARCALTAVFALLAAAHVSSLAAVAPVAALLGAFSALFMPASMAMMPSLVGPARLTAANAVYTGFVQAGSLLGPALGGVLVAVTGPATAFAADAGSYAVSAVSLALMAGAGRRAAAAGPAPGLVPVPDAEGTAEALALAPAPPAPPATGAAEDAGGNVWVLLGRSRLLQVILVVSLTANFALLATSEVALPTLAHARFGAGGYGAVLTCLAVASIAGALVAGRAGDRIRPGYLIAGAFLVAAAAITAAPFLGGLPGLAAALAVVGVGLGFDNVVSVTVIQRWAPPAMLGRVWGLLLLASAASFPVSTFVAGVLTRHLGPTAVFVITGALLALSMVFGLSQREFRDFGADLDLRQTGS